MGLLTLSAIFLFGGCGKKAPVETVAPPATEASSVPSTTEARKQKENLETILVLGLDKNEYPDDSRELRPVK